MRVSTARIVKDGTLTGFVSTLEDVTVNIADDDRLKAEAQHDPLTGLPNRGYFLELLEAALVDLAGDGAQFAVLFIDLDRFKQVNDNHGHAVGDELLIATAERIAHSLRPGDRVARLGGDEFAVLMAGVDLEGVTSVVERLQAAVARPFRSAARTPSSGPASARVLVDDPTGRPVLDPAGRRHGDVPREGRRGQVRGLRRGAAEQRRSRSSRPSRRCVARWNGPS